MSDSLQPYGLQHARLPCPSPSPRVCPSSCPLSQWCHPTISSISFSRGSSQPRGRTCISCVSCIAGQFFTCWAVGEAHLILSCPLFLLPSIFPRFRVFSSGSALHIRWPKSWSFSFKISPSNEYPRLISYRIDWLDLLAVQGTLKSLLQHHSSKASILWCSAFFIVQLSHPYMTQFRTNLG